MRSAFALALAVIAIPASADAEAFRKGPYLQRVTQTGVTVMWEGEIAPATVTVRSAGEPDVVVESPARALHEVRIEGLRPGRRYRYTVSAPGGEASGELATAPASSDPFSFVVFGDTRSNADSHRALVERVRREVPDFILGTGDMVNDGGVERDWQTFFTIERELLRDNVLYPAVGNHDRQGRARTADAFRRYFSVPADSPDPERYYSFQYGNSLFLVLDSNSYSFALTDQTAWLERELARSHGDPSIRHRFVVMHHPPFSVSLHGGQPELREMWTPIFEKYAVDAVFSGHDHVYSRAEHHGIRYFVSGGGGAPLYPRDSRPSEIDVAATIYFERTFHYLRVQVIGDFVEVAAIRDDGTLIESLSWGALPPRPAPVASPPAPPTPVEHPVAVASPAPSSKGCAVAGAGRGASPASAPAVVVLVVAIAIRARLRRRRCCPTS